MLLPVEVKTGEEDEELLASYHGKLYLVCGEEVKQRCEGVLKFLKHKETGLVRLVMRQDKTFLMRANHYPRKLEDAWELKVSMIKEHAREWKGVEEGKVVHFCLRLQADGLEHFENSFNQAVEFNTAEE